jgi:hypothetical protein
VSGRKTSFKFDWERALAATQYRKDVKAIGRAVASHAWADGSHAHPGVETLMGETSYSRRAVIGALAVLTGDDWWSIGPRAGRPRGSNNEYRLAIPPWINDLLPGRPDGKDEFEHEQFLTTKRTKYAAKQIASGLLSSAVASATPLAAVGDESDVSAVGARGALPEGSAKGIGTPSADLGPCANIDPDHVQTIAGPCANSTPVLAGQEPPTILKNNPKREQASSFAVDASASTLRDDADASPSDTDDLSKATRTTSRRRRNEALMLAAKAVNRADLSQDEIGNVLDDLSLEMNGAAYLWALERTCAEKKRTVQTTHYLIPADLWPRVAIWGLMWARNQPKVPESLSDAMGGFSWPAGGNAAARPRSESGPREQLERVIHYAANPGITDEQVLNDYYAKVSRFTEEQLAAQVAYVRKYRKKIWFEWLEGARNQYQEKGAAVTERQVTVLAIKYAIKHYEGKWPMFVVPGHVPDVA